MSLEQSLTRAFTLLKESCFSDCFLILSDPAADDNYVQWDLADNQTAIIAVEVSSRTYAQHPLGISRDADARLRRIGFQPPGQDGSNYRLSGPSPDPAVMARLTLLAWAVAFGPVPRRLTAQTADPRVSSTIQTFLDPPPEYLEQTSLPGHCTACGAPLDDAALISGRCASCGELLPLLGA
jgi:hypothetical protein